MHIAFSLLDFELWGLRDEITLDVCSLVIGNWHGSLLYIYRDGSGLRQGGFDFLFLRRLLSRQ